MSNDHPSSDNDSHNFQGANLDYSSNNIDIRLDQAWTYINQKNVAKAQATCHAINVDFPNDADGWYATSFLAFQLKQTAPALSAINQAIKLQPKNLQWLSQKVETLLLMADKPAAKKLAQTLKNQLVTDLNLAAQYATTFTKLADFDQARFYYLQGLSLINEKSQPSQAAQFYFNLASVERYLGKIEEAQQHLNQTIALNANDFEAYLLRSSLKKQTSENNHIEQLQQLLKQNIKHPIAKAQVCYALAKEQEDLAQYSASFESLNLGAKARRAQMKYELKHDLCTLKQLRKTFDKSLFEQHAATSTGYDNNEAIFILGLPRTGSTLVERIVGNHQQVFAAGELNNFAIQMMNECKKIAKEVPKSRTQLVELTKNIDFEVLGERYINSTRPETGHTAHFIDKLPLNSLNIGVIHLALPKAKIIHVTRHPLDTCYAIYKQLFSNGYPFSYDLTELAQYYIEHHTMMQHWLTVMPDVIHQVAYEDVINNLAVEAKKMIRYCQLDWQAQCSDFQKNVAPSTTASATQVRQKIYQSSKGKWRHFEQELSPIKQLLEQAGICCD